MKALFHTRELQDWVRSDGFSFTQGCKLMKIQARQPVKRDKNPFGKSRLATMLFDVVADPGMIAPLADAEIEASMIRLLITAMAASDSPLEQYARLGLPEPSHASPESIAAACVVATQRGREFIANGIDGFPKMPFANTLFGSKI